MFLTKESDYAVRIMRVLADGERQKVETISTQAHIPHLYTYKILKKLEHAGFLKSVRGIQGGYILAKPLTEINLHDIVIATDENPFLHECLREESKCPLLNIDSQHPCKMHFEFARIQNILESEMKRKSLAEIF